MITNPQPKKVTFVISGLGAGGAERVISQIATHWLDRGFVVEIASFDSANDPVFHPLDPSVALHRLGRGSNHGRAPGLAKLQNLRDLRQLLRTSHPDVVVSFLTKNNLLALIAAAGLSIPVICCERNNPERQEKSFAWNAMLALMYRKARLIVCQTEAVKRCFPKAVSDRLRVIPNPVSAWPCQRQSTDRASIVAVGRLTEQKGFDILLDAFAAIGSATAGWQLLLYGEGPDKAALASRIDRLGLADKVYLKGNSPAPGGWVKCADLFVLPSRYEGFPNVLAEAMAVGLPVVATRCDFGPAEMIEPENSGLLVAPENVTELAEALTRCIADEALRDRLGRNAMLSIRRFSPESVLRRWDDVLAEALKPPMTNFRQVVKIKLEND